MSLLVPQKLVCFQKDILKYFFSQKTRWQKEKKNSALSYDTWRSFWRLIQVQRLKNWDCEDSSVYEKKERRRACFEQNALVEYKGYILIWFCMLVWCRIILTFLCFSFPFRRMMMSWVCVYSLVLNSGGTGCWWQTCLGNYQYLARSSLRILLYIHTWKVYVFNLI